jgi:ribonuclease BN (tRNA processing enzyme)
MSRRWSRRELLAAAATLAAAPFAFAGESPPPAGRTRLILLGTGGGPRPKRESNASSQVVIAGDRLYVIDCGDGVARQLVLAGASLDALRHVFVTHHHSDHNADYGNLLLLAWASGLRTPVDTWGPPPLERMTRLFLELNAYDIGIRIEEAGFVPFEPLIRAHERSEPGLVLEDENVRVTSALVAHPPVAPAFAYRFDAADRSIVVSGDTARSESLIRLAKGADVLVHEAMYLPAVERLVSRIPNASRLRDHLLASHTSVEDCARIATAAGVKMLVLSHLVPPDDPQVSEQDWLTAARPHYEGPIVVGRDLLEI